MSQEPTTSQETENGPAVQRGLANYLPNVKDDPEGKLGVDVPLDRIQLPKRENLRATDDELERLADSIRQEGLLQPVVLRPNGDEDSFTIVAGRHRTYAHQLLGLDVVPAIVRRDMDDAAAAVATGIENLQRKNVAPYEEAQAYQAAVDAGLSQKEVAARVGVAPSTVSRKLRLLRIPEVLAKQIGVGERTMDAVDAVLQLEEWPELMEKAALHLVERSGGWNPEHAMRAHLEREGDLARPFNYGTRDGLSYKWGTDIETTAYGKEVHEKCTVLDLDGVPVTPDVDVWKEIFQQHKERRDKETAEADEDDSVELAPDKKAKIRKKHYRARLHDRTKAALQEVLSLTEDHTELLKRIIVRRLDFHRKGDAKAFAEVIDRPAEEVIANFGPRRYNDDLPDREDDYYLFTKQEVGDQAADRLVLACLVFQKARGHDAAHPHPETMEDEVLKTVCNQSVKQLAALAKREATKEVKLKEAKLKEAKLKEKAEKEKLNGGGD